MSSHEGLVFMYAAVAALVPLFRLTSLRVRNEALPPADRDPQLGRKFVLCLFTHACLLMILCGLTVSASDVTWYVMEPLQQAEDRRGEAVWVPPLPQPDGLPPLPPLPEIDLPAAQPAPPLAVSRPPKQWWNSQQRLAVTLVGSGLLHGGLAWTALLVLTNHRTQPMVGRSFVVLRFGVCGVVMLVVNTLILHGFLAEGDTRYEPLAFYLAVVGVWGPAMLLHLGWMLVLYRRKRSLG